MIDEKQRELQELSDEVEIILSVKDNISSEEIGNFLNKFHLLSEGDIRNKIRELTGDSKYICDFISKDDKKELVNTLSKAKDDNVSNLLRENEEVKENLTNDVNNEEKTTSQENLSCKDIEESEFTEENIPEVIFVKADTKYGQLSLEWGWPERIDKSIICYRMDRFPLGPSDACASQILINKDYNEEIGSYLIHKVIEGNYYFCLYTMAEYNGKAIFSEGVRRLVVNKTPSEIFYEIKRKKTLFGKLKSAELILSTSDKELNMPQLTLVSKYGNMPLQKSDGKSLLNTDYQTISVDNPIILDIPIENLNKNMYVKLFFLDDSNSKLYRIISPAKENLYFK